MSKSLSAKIMSELLKFWPKLTAEETEHVLDKAMQREETKTPAPLTVKTRHEDTENGRIFYHNEKSKPQSVIFYIHGGAYFYDIIPPHWQLIEKVAKRTGAEFIVPAYRLVPYATYKEAYDLIVPLYKKVCREFRGAKIMLMGDSAGGGFCLALAEYFREEGLKMPDEVILISPWVDVTMENEDIKDYQDRDPFLAPGELKDLGKRWAGDLDPHDWRISPVYGDLAGIHNVTAFIGTADILYPDTVKCFDKLEKDPSNELIIAEEMNHIYPLMPISEAMPAVNKICQVVMR